VVCRLRGSDSRIRAGNAPGYRPSSTFVFKPTFKPGRERLVLWAEKGSNHAAEAWKMLLTWSGDQTGHGRDLKPD
jgi:hypothetical protein